MYQNLGMRSSERTYLTVLFMGKTQSLSLPERSWLAGVCATRKSIAILSKDVWRRAKPEVDPK